MSGLEIVALGGVGEFGKNVLWLRGRGSSLLLDIGVSFPDETFPGIDRIAPDLSSLRGERIEAVLLTHGHEDHIGALPLLREWCEAPVYGLPFTLALAKRRLAESEASMARLHEIRGGERMQAGEFAFSFFRVSHSVPDSAAILIETQGAKILHSGDFKLDTDPPDGEWTDRDAIAAAVGSGVDLALIDSTNAERPGHAPSERLAGQGLAKAFLGASGRIVLTTFSSHVARISQAAEAGLALDRRVAFLGRSMRTVSEIAERFGRLRLPAGRRVAAPDLALEPPSRLLCFVGGSQGEPFSALSRLALDEHTDLKLSPGDLVLFSSRTIPGHERSVNRVADHLARRGVRVLREAEPPLHVSGHAHREDLADWLDLARPRHVLPVHGDRRMLAAAAEVAAERGLPRERIHLLDNGDRLVLSDGEASVERGAVPAGRIYLDSRPEMVEPGVVKDRRQMAEEGFVVVLLPADPRGEVSVVARGVAAPERELAGEVGRAVAAVLARATEEERADTDWMRAETALAAKRACRRVFGVRPVIVPVVV
ncbi:MAG: ribonuclease J [Acidobacteriota bacterium]